MHLKVIYCGEIESLQIIQKVEGFLFFLREFQQGCQIFLGTTNQNGGKMYQMAIKCTKWPKDIQFTQNGIFWFETIPSGNTEFQPSLSLTKVNSNL
jgi:hypothetical protein